MKIKVSLKINGVEVYKVLTIPKYRCPACNKICYMFRDNKGRYSLIDKQGTSFHASTCRKAKKWK